MTYIVSITSQGQLSIPIKLRRQLGFDKTNKAIITVYDSHLTLEPAGDILSLRGSVKSSIKYNPRQAREQFEQYLAEEGLGNHHVKSKDHS